MKRHAFRRGFTLLEAMVVVAIIVVVVAISSPVFTRAKHAAKIRASLSNLHQMHIATMIYQGDHGGGGVYGDIGPMGLPPSYYIGAVHFGLPLSLFSSPCGHHPSDGNAIINYYYRPWDGGPAFVQEAYIFQENLVLFKDLNCTDHSVALENHFRSRRGLAVLLSGQLVNHHKPGNWNDPEWWAPPLN